MMKNVILILGIIFIGFSAQAQKRNAKLTFAVDGVCEMCKKRIEKAALKSKGVKFADWDMKRKQLTVVVNLRRTSKEKVQRVISEVGHDTELFKSSQETYENLHSCCKYRDEIPH